MTQYSHTLYQAYITLYLVSSTLYHFFQYPRDLLQHKKFQEKRNPFHGRFTHKTARFWFKERMNIWRKSSSCVQSLKIPSKWGSFGCEKDFIFLIFFTVVCGLYSIPYNLLSKNSHKFPIITSSRNIRSFAVKSFMMVSIALL